jgi:hypothetical protein
MEEMIFQKKDKEKQAVQDLIPIQAIKNGRVITKDNRVIQILKVNALNLELMSEYELNNVFETFEIMLKSINFPVQIEIVSQPMNLNKYLNEQKALLEKMDNPYRKKALESYIEYIKQIETSRSIMQRKRYIIFDVKIAGVKQSDYETALEQLDEKEKIIFNALKDLELNSERISEAEINQFFQVMFDYEAALQRPILTDKVPNITTGGKEKCLKSSKEQEKKIASNF